MPALSSNQLFADPNLEIFKYRGNINTKIIYHPTTESQLVMY